MVLQRGARRVLLPLVASISLLYRSTACVCAVVLRVCCNYRSPEAEESEGHSCLVGLYRGYLPMSREDEIVAGHPFKKSLKLGFKN